MKNFCSTTTTLKLKEKLVTKVSMGYLKFWHRPFLFLPFDDSQKVTADLISS